jgi:hypothetical protein
MIVATDRELADRGVVFPHPPIQQPFGWWSMFEDTEGNRFALDQDEDASVSDVENGAAVPTSGCTGLTGRPARGGGKS